MIGAGRLRAASRLVLLLAGAVGLGAIAFQPLGGPGPSAAGARDGRSEGFVPLAGVSAAGLPTSTTAPSLVGAGDPPLTDLAGRPVWIVFWATWCPPCREEMPALSAVAEAHADDGLVILAVSVEEPNAVVEEFVAELDLRMRVLTDPRGRSMRRWAVFGLPTHYFVAPDGTIAWRWFGPLSADEIERRAREALGGS